MGDVSAAIMRGWPPPSYPSPPPPAPPPHTNLQRDRNTNTFLCVFFAFFDFGIRIFCVFFLYFFSSDFSDFCWETFSAGIFFAVFLTRIFPGTKQLSKLFFPHLEFSVNQLLSFRIIMFPKVQKAIF